MIKKSSLLALFLATLTLEPAQADPGYNVHMYKLHSLSGSLRLSFGGAGCKDATPAAGEGVSVINWEGQTVPVVCMNDDGWKQVVMVCAYKGGRPPLDQPIPPGETVEIAVDVRGGPGTTIAYYTIAPDCVPETGQVIEGTSAK